jgi:hypothetical protein
MVFTWYHGPGVRSGRPAAVLGGANGVAHAARRSPAAAMDLRTSLAGRGRYCSWDLSGIFLAIIVFFFYMVFIVMDCSRNVQELLMAFSELISISFSINYIVVLWEIHWKAD